MVIVINIDTNGNLDKIALELLDKKLSEGYKVTSCVEYRKRVGMSDCNVSSAIVYTIEKL